MQTPHQSFTNLVLSYDALLQRYASRFLHSSQPAPSLVQQVFESFYEHYSNCIPADPRNVLRSLTTLACQQWLEQQLISANLVNSTHPVNPDPDFNALFAKKPKNPV